MIIKQKYQYAVIILSSLVFLFSTSFKCYNKALRTTKIELTNSSPDEILCFISPGIGTSIRVFSTKSQVLANINLFRVEAGESNRIGLASYCNAQVWEEMKEKTDTMTLIFIKRKTFDQYSLEELDQRNDLKDIRFITRTQIVNNGCRITYP